MKKNNRITGLFRKVIVILLAVVLAAGVPSPTDVQAASQKSKATSAYRFFMSKSKIPWGTYSRLKVSTSKCSFTLAYINNDNIPELVVTTHEVAHAVGYGAIFTYKNGKVQGVANFNQDDSKFKYYKKKGVYISCYVMGGETHNYCKYPNSGSDCVLATFYNNGVRTDMKKGTTYYKANKYVVRTKTSKSTFNKTLKKLVGNNKKVAKVSLKKNTAANRKKYIK